MGTESGAVCGGQRACTQKEERKGKVPSWAPGSGLWGGAGMEPEAVGEGEGRERAGGRQGAGGCAVHSVPQGLPLPPLQSCPDLPRGRGQAGFQAADRTDQPR